MEGASAETWALTNIPILDLRRLKCMPLSAFRLGRWYMSENHIWAGAGSMNTHLGSTPKTVCCYGQHLILHAAEAAGLGERMLLALLSA